MAAVSHNAVTTFSALAEAAFTFAPTTTSEQVSSSSQDMSASTVSECYGNGGACAPVIVQERPRLTSYLNISSSSALTWALLVYTLILASAFVLYWSSGFIADRYLNPNPFWIDRDVRRSIEAQREQAMFHSLPQLNRPDSVLQVQYALMREMIAQIVSPLRERFRLPS